MSKKLLEVKNLKINFKTDYNSISIIRDVNFYIEENEILGVVGESGSGKSITSLSIMRLLPIPPAQIVDGEVIFEGENLLKKTEKQMEKIRGNKISMIFQEPMTSLNPVLTCGEQIAESLILHKGLSRKEAMKKTVELLKLVGVPSPEKRINEYPHQLSGGLRQRVMIASALSCNPKLLIADEPTTALDVTIQAQILDLIKHLKEKFNMSMILITHDLGVIAEIAERVIVMYAGKIVEKADVVSLFINPMHPYTVGLIKSVPQLNSDKSNPLYNIKGIVPDPGQIPQGCSFSPRCPIAEDICYKKEPDLIQVDENHFTACWLYQKLENQGGSLMKMSQLESTLNTNKKAILEVKNLKKYFPLKRKKFTLAEKNFLKAVDGVSFSVNYGETLGLVGESGCGKSTTGNLILRLIDATEGQVIFDGKDLFKLKKKEMNEIRKDIQVVFQDPYSSLNPRMTVGDIVAEPLRYHKFVNKEDEKQRVKELFEIVGLSANYIDRYPHEFSGGQRQRIAIARAISLNPKLIICDEPVSALDVSIQAQVLNLLSKLQKELNISYIFIAHGLPAVKYISDKIAVMYLGKIVEIIESNKINEQSKHPYTQALISAIPKMDPLNKDKRERIILRGDVPNQINPPNGCRFHTRCPYAMSICKTDEPKLKRVEKNHSVACHLY